MAIPPPTHPNAIGLRAFPSTIKRVTTMSEMVRINAAIRDETISNLLAHRFASERNAILKMKQDYENLADHTRKMAYEMVYSKKAMDMLTSAPHGYFPKTSSVQVRVYEPGNEDNYDTVSVRFDDDRPVPFSHYYQSAIAAVVPRDHEYFKYRDQAEEAFEKTRKAEDDLRRAESLLRQKAVNIIGSVTTMKRLFEIWPEVQEFVPEVVSGNGGGLPVQMIEEINREFNITPK